MLGVGLIVLYLGYAILYWGVQAIEGNDQSPFLTYLFWFGK